MNTTATQGCTMATEDCTSAMSPDPLATLAYDRHLRRPIPSLPPPSILVITGTQHWHNARFFVPKTGAVLMGRSWEI